jgi:hypothetical protein
MPEWSFAVPRTSGAEFPTAADAALAAYRNYVADQDPMSLRDPGAHGPIDAVAEAQLVGALDAAKALVAARATDVGDVQASIRVDHQADAHHINVWVGEAIDAPEAEDPAALHARIAELESQLAGKA